MFQTKKMLVNKCIVCSVPATKRCGQCHSVWYCNQAHQRDDWKKHRIQCQSIEFKRKPLIFEPLECFLHKLSPSTLLEVFAMERYDHLKGNQNEYAECAKIAEGSCIVRMLHKENSQQIRLISCYALMVAKAFYILECKEEFDCWLSIAKKLDGNICPKSQEIWPRVVNTTTDYFLKVKLRFGPFQRSEHILRQGVTYFNSLLPHPAGIKIILNEMGYDIVATKNFKKNAVVLEEKASLIGSLDLSRCYHCTKASQNYMTCRRNCGFHYCSQTCELEAWNMYHECLCHPGFFAQLSKITSYILKAASSSSAKMPVLQLKLLGVALKNNMEIWKIEPFCYLYCGFHEIALSSFPKHTRYVYDAMMEVNALMKSGVSKIFSSEWLLRVTSLLIANTFTLNAGKDEVNPKTLGTGLMLGNITSLFNHSCCPNAMWSNDRIPGTIQIIAENNIQKGDFVRISYGVDGARQERRKRLKICYGFDCACELCLTGF
jgi:hypothetical protein